MARLTGLEPATPGVTGRYSNQLSYNRVAGGIGDATGAVNGKSHPPFRLFIGVRNAPPAKCLCPVGRSLHGWFIQARFAAIRR